MCLGINAINNLSNACPTVGITGEGSGPAVAGNFLNSVFGSLFSNGSSGNPGAQETSGSVACIFSDLSLGENSNGAGAGGDVIIGSGGFSGGGGGGGGSCGSLA